MIRSPLVLKPQIRMYVFFSDIGNGMIIEHLLHYNPSVLDKNLLAMLTCCSDTAAQQVVGLRMRSAVSDRGYGRGHIVCRHHDKVCCGIGAYLYEVVGVEIAVGA